MSVISEMNEISLLIKEIPMFPFYGQDDISNINFKTWRRQVSLILDVIIQFEPKTARGKIQRRAVKDTLKAILYGGLK